MPLIRKNQAKSLMKQEKYVEALEIFYDLSKDSNYTRDSYQLALNKYIMNCDVESAVNLYLQFKEKYYSGSYDIFEVSSSTNTNEELISTDRQEELYENLVSVLKNPPEGLTSETLGIFSYTLKYLPVTYKDVGNLRLFFDDAADRFGYWNYSSPAYTEQKYVMAHRSLISDLWEYSVVRNFALSHVQEYISSGTWRANRLYGESISFTTTISSSGITHSFETNGLATPDIVHNSYELVDNVLIYKNSNGSKLCDVFKFTFDISDPSFVDVYCYENQITVRLYRDFLVDTTQ